MAKSLTENAKIDFLIKLDALKRITGSDDNDIAKLLGCSLKTVGNMRSDPFSTSGRYILMVQAYYDREERRRKDYE